MSTTAVAFLLIQAEAPPRSRRTIDEQTHGLVLNQVSTSIAVAHREPTSVGT